MKGLFGFLLLVVTGSVLAGDHDTRLYQLPNHGNLQLQVPSSWRDQLRQPPNQLPPTITLNTRGDNIIQVLITPIWAFREDIVLPSGQALKQRVEETIKEVSAQAVEKSIATREIKGKQGGGYYYFATDKAPQPGEYKYLTQGMIRIGELLATFTILSNDGAEKDVERALKVISSAEHVQ